MMCLVRFVIAPLRIMSKYEEFCKRGVLLVLGGRQHAFRRIEGALRFRQGSPALGVAVEFIRAFARHVCSSRMANYSLIKQVCACAAVCDEVIEQKTEEQIATRSFPYEGRDRLFEERCPSGSRGDMKGLKNSHSSSA